MKCCKPTLSRGRTPSPKTLALRGRFCIDSKSAFRIIKELRPPEGSCLNSFNCSKIGDYAHATFPGFCCIPKAMGDTKPTSMSDEISRPTLIHLLRSTRDLIDHYEPIETDIPAMVDLNRCLNEVILQLEASPGQQ